MRTVAISLVALLGCYRSSPPPVTPLEVPVARAGVPIANADPLAFLPADSEVVLVLDARSIRTSSVWKQVEPLLRRKLASALSLFASECHFDPITTLRRVSFGLRNIEGTPTGIGVVRGLKRDTMMVCVERVNARDGRTVTIDHGVVTIPGTKTLFTFADDSTLVAMLGPGASPTLLTAAIDSGAPLRVSQPFVEMAAKVETGPIWFVVDGSAKLLAGAMGFGAHPLGVMGSFEISDTVGAHVRVRFAEPAQATAAVALVQGQVGSLSPYVDGLEVLAEDTDGVVRFRMTLPQLQQMLGFFGGMP